MIIVFILIIFNKMSLQYVAAALFFPLDAGIEAYFYDTFDDKAASRDGNATKNSSKSHDLSMLISPTTLLLLCSYPFSSNGGMVVCIVA